MQISVDYKSVLLSAQSEQTSVKEALNLPQMTSSKSIRENFVGSLSNDYKLDQKLTSQFVESETPLTISSAREFFKTAAGTKKTSQNLVQPQINLSPKPKFIPQSEPKADIVKAQVILDRFDENSHDIPNHLQFRSYNDVLTLVKTLQLAQDKIASLDSSVKRLEQSIESEKSYYQDRINRNKEAKDPFIKGLERDLSLLKFERKQLIQNTPDKKKSKQSYIQKRDDYNRRIKDTSAKLSKLKNTMQKENDKWADICNRKVSKLQVNLRSQMTERTRMEALVKRTNDAFDNHGIKENHLKAAKEWNELSYKGHLFTAPMIMGSWHQHLQPLYDPTGDSDNGVVSTSKYQKQVDYLSKDSVVNGPILNMPDEDWSEIGNQAWLQGAYNRGNMFVIKSHLEPEIVEAHNKAALSGKDEDLKAYYDLIIKSDNTALSKPASGGKLAAKGLLVQDSVKKGLSLEGALLKLNDQTLADKLRNNSDFCNAYRLALDEYQKVASNVGHDPKDYIDPSNTREQEIESDLGFSGDFQSKFDDLTRWLQRVPGTRSESLEPTYSAMELIDAAKHGYIINETSGDPSVQSEENRQTLMPQIKSSINKEITH
ncbi:hypothetical protein [Pleionea sp. CnH1-48]|uniref:hypothetical protein n=1 Tax=Pleionea sp. CnH1-48 TaxID=2954494 RepID=UPI0020979353|nr:hypothetical protein [Pleionea sp. CnH1-48]MCO7225964.1 hypothetical protein [Pleionea sp. CnH1-48]